MGCKYNLLNKKFGRLFVVAQAPPNNRNQTMWNCVCECGSTTTVLGYNLVKGLTISCGCYRKERQVSNKYVHGDSHGRLHNIWSNMKTRCENKKVRAFRNYGARGISVCEEWKTNYVAFKKWAMQNGYKEHLTIERIDNSKGYSPDNCRWATVQEQARNKRNLRLLTLNGETHCITEWAEITGIKESAIRARIDRFGWTVERALSEGANKKKVV